MTITLKQLRYLVAVAESLHFRKAAAACHVSQPALTTQIQELEDRLGVRLIERSRRKVLLTPIGEEIVARAKALLQDVEQIEDLARGRREPLVGPLRLGVIPTLGPYLLPRVLPAVRTAYPDLQLYLREDQTDRLLDRLRLGQLDLLLLALPVNEAEVEAMPLFDEPFVLAAPPEHRLAKKKKLVEGDLAGEGVLLLEEGHCLRDQALSVCRLAGAVESDGFQATSLNTLTQMVANGLGVTLLPALALETEARPDSRIVTHPFAGRPPERRIGLVWRRSSGRGREFRLLGDCLKANLPSGVSPVDAS